MPEEEYVPNPTVQSTETGFKGSQALEDDWNARQARREDSNKLSQQGVDLARRQPGEAERGLRVAAGKELAHAWGGMGLTAAGGGRQAGARNAAADIAGELQETRSRLEGDAISEGLAHNAFVEQQGTLESDRAKAVSGYLPLITDAINRNKDNPAAAAAELQNLAATEPDPSVRDWLMRVADWSNRNAKRASYDRRNPFLSAWGYGPSTDHSAMPVYGGVPVSQVSQRYDPVTTS